MFHPTEQTPKLTSIRSLKDLKIKIDALSTQSEPIIWDFEFQDFADEAVALFDKAVDKRHIVSGSCFCFAQSNLSDRGALFLAKILRSENCPQELGLNISSTQISITGFEAIMSALGRTKSLNDLSLYARNISLGLEGCFSITRMLTADKRIGQLTLRMENNGLQGDLEAAADISGIQAIHDALHIFGPVKELSLGRGIPPKLVFEMEEIRQCHQAIAVNKQRMGSVLVELKKTSKPAFASMPAPLLHIVLEYLIEDYNNIEELYSKMLIAYALTTQGLQSLEKNLSHAHFFHNAAGYSLLRKDEWQQLLLMKLQKQIKGLTVVSTNSARETLQIIFQNEEHAKTCQAEFQGQGIINQINHNTITIRFKNLAPFLEQYANGINTSCFFREEAKGEADKPTCALL